MKRLNLEQMLIFAVLLIIGLLASGCTTKHLYTLCYEGPVRPISDCAVLLVRQDIGPQIVFVEKIDGVSDPVMHFRSYPSIWHFKSPGLQYHGEFHLPPGEHKISIITGLTNKYDFVQPFAAGQVYELTFIVESEFETEVQSDMVAAVVNTRYDKWGQGYRPRAVVVGSQKHTQVTKVYKPLIQFLGSQADVATRQSGNSQFPDHWQALAK